MSDEPTLEAVFRGAVEQRDRIVTEVMRRAEAIGHPMTIWQARLAYDVVNVELVIEAHSEKDEERQ